MGEFLPQDPRNYSGFIHAIGRIRNPIYDDENAWTRMQKLLNSRVHSFAEPSHLRIREIVHDAFVVRRAALLGRLAIDESDFLIDRVLTTPLHLRERRIVCQVLPHLENVLPVEGAAPLFQGILTWRPPVEPHNGRVLRQIIVESVPILEAQSAVGPSGTEKVPVDRHMCSDILELPEGGFKSDVEDSGPLETSFPELVTDTDIVVTVTELPPSPIGIRDYLDKLPF